MIITIMVLLFVIALVLLLWQISNMVSVFYGSPYVMADKKVIFEALRLAKLKKGEIFYDLGCGRGDVLIEAAKLGAKSTGFEISPYYYIYAKLKTWRYHNIRVQYQNIDKVDLSKANVVYCYLLPQFLEKLAPKFKKELKRGARLISISFQVPGLKLISETKCGNKTIFIYLR